MCAASTVKVSGARCGRRGNGMEDVLLSEIFSRNIIMCSVISDLLSPYFSIRSLGCLPSPIRRLLDDYASGSD